MPKKIITEATEIVAIRVSVSLCSLFKEGLYFSNPFRSVSEILFPDTKNIERKKAHKISKKDTEILNRNTPEIALIIKFIEIAIISKKVIFLK